MRTWRKKPRHTAGLGTAAAGVRHRSTRMGPGPVLLGEVEGAPSGMVRPSPGAVPALHLGAPPLPVPRNFCELVPLSSLWTSRHGT